MTKSEFGTILRRKILFSTIAIFSAIVFIHLFILQILETELYAEKSNENSIKKVVETAPRGIFLDRNYNVLVSNKPAFTVQITPSYYDNSLDNYVETVLGVDSGYVSSILNKYKQFSQFKPRKIRRDADYEFIAWYEENSEKLNGVEYIVELQRDYSFGITGSHIFGYIKEIDAKSLEKRKDVYSIGDYIGYSGIEKTYEDYLRGEKGFNYILVDSKQKPKGKYLEGSQDKPAKKGHDLVLTLDLGAQRIAEEALKGRKGAVVAIEPSTGEILVLVSSPDFDLAEFGAVTPAEVIDSHNKNPDKPLFNRATMAIYPPGSTFKMLEAIIGLEESVINTYSSIKCSGGMFYGDRFFSCDHVHGRVAVVEAIERSCNTFFYDLTLKIGFERWSEYSSQFGFGEYSGIDIPEDSRGILPSVEYYNRVYGKGKWTKGNLLSLAIGQGELSTTPIQLAKYTSLLANFGKTKVPHLVRGFLDTEAEKIVPLEYENIEINISHRTLEIVREGMYRVVHGKDGTARHIKLPGITIAGKTGTSQNPHGENHAIFIAFAPYENPQIAVAVIVERCRYGGTHAAPIARDIIRAYLTKEIKSDLEITSK